MSLRGTKDHPVLVNYGKGKPVKYRCRVCQLWFVEDWLEACFRDVVFGDGEPVICQDCFERQQRTEWEAHR